MKAFVLALSVSLVSLPALASSYVDGVIVSVDSQRKLVVLKDRSVMQVDPSLDAATIETGKKVRIFAELDEDGFAPVTRIETAKQ